MTTNRLEAFSDGVLAIIITIMVLELKVPEGADFFALQPIVPKLLSYILSFIYVGIYWNNHHHLFQAVQQVNGKVLWANLVLLFSLSLLPFTTAWMGQNHFGKSTVFLYGINLLFCALTFMVLAKMAENVEGKNSRIGEALKNRTKEMVSAGLYLLGIVLSYYVPAVSMACYAIVAVVWLIPDTRIEKQFKG